MGVGLSGRASGDRSGGSQLAGNIEGDVLERRSDRLELYIVARTERVDDCLDERFRRGGARRHADAVQPFDIGPRDIAGAFDETRGRTAGALRHLDEAQRVGALRAADDEQATDL